MGRTLRIVAATALALALAAPWGARAQVVGLGAFDLPEWFKVSFLEIEDDAREAADAGRHLMMFFHLENCPYCKRMLDDSFTDGSPEAGFIARHFDVVALDVEGDLEVTVGDRTVTEEEYSREIGVQYTPTIVFYEPDGTPIIKVVGYRAPEAFAHVLDFVREKAYADGRYLDFTDYVAVRERQVWDLPDHPRFADTDDLAKVGKPLMVVIEDPACHECRELHSRLLPQEDVQEHLDGLVVVRIDSRSERALVTPAGKSTTEAQFARDLGIHYRPGIVFYDGAEEIFRVTGALNPYHFREAVRYVAGLHHRRHGTWGSYLGERRRQIIADGGVVDYTFTD